MNRKYLAFDIETAKSVPGPDFNWRPHRPLGISCIASHSLDLEQPRVWLTQKPDKTPAPKMSQSDVTAFIRYLSDAVATGFTLLSWNGLAFDFDILAEESGLHSACRQLALEHHDMMFHVVCQKGFPVSLRNAAAGLGLQGKLEGVEGENVPVLWAEGKFDLVKEYVAQDVRATLSVAMEAEKRREFAWKSRSGTISTMPLPHGWLSVKAALNLPLPDTSWMQHPPARSQFMEWLEE